VTNHVSRSATVTRAIRSPSRRELCLSGRFRRPAQPACRDARESAVILGGSPRGLQCHESAQITHVTSPIVTSTMSTDAHSRHRATVPGARMKTVDVATSGEAPHAAHVPVAVVISSGGAIHNFDDAAPRNARQPWRLARAGSVSAARTRVGRCTASPFPTSSSSPSTGARAIAQRR
jgi:hypothetical protein